MAVVVFAVVWIVIGASVGFYEARRGHWRWLWLLGAIAGPIALPLARQLHEQERHTRPVTLDRGDAIDDGLHVLVGLDGSDAAATGATLVDALFGDRIGEVTLATVVDYGTAELPTSALAPPEGWPERLEAEEMLGATAERLTALIGLHPTTVILSGHPGRALLQHAIESGADVIVAGRRGRGLTDRALGSCADVLAHHATIPVVLVPVPSTASGDSTAGAAATRTHPV